MATNIPIAVQTNLKVIGENLAAQRKLLNLRAEDVALRAGVTTSTISKIENGKPVGIVEMLKTLRILGLSDDVVAATDPYNKDVGKLRALEKLPERVRRTK